MKKSIRRRRKIKKWKRMAYRVIQAFYQIVQDFWNELLDRRRLVIAATMAAVVAVIILTACQSIKADRAEDKQTEEETAQATEMTETEVAEEFGELYGTYEYPFNEMSQDWSGEQVEGFVYHDITEECEKAGGRFPVIAQVYTYIVCNQYGVDYEMVFALIERESKCVWTAAGDNGQSIGYMQIAQKWHKERMERLHVSDLTSPFQNVTVGVDFLSEIQEQLKGTVPDDMLPYCTLAVYNYGLSGAKKHLWSNGVYKYSYNTEIMERAAQLKEEKAAVLEGEQKDADE